MNKIIYEIAMFTLADEKDNVYSEKTKEELKENFKQTLGIND